MYSDREGPVAMHLSAVDQAFWFASLGGEILLSGLLFYRRRYTVFPFFLAWILATILAEVPIVWTLQHYSIEAYRQTYIITTVLDFALQLGVLVEIAHRVLKPGQKWMPKPLRFSLLAGMVIAFLATTIWTLSSRGHSETFALTSAHLLQVTFLFAFLRLLLFALIAGFSQMLGITWRNHVIRLASGLAFYSAVSLVTQLTISHLSASNQDSYLRDFHLLVHTQTIGYLLALAFWVWSFVQKDAPRREFTPQMERFLVTITQTARRSRVGFARNLEK